MKNTSLPRLIARTALIAVIVSPSAGVLAQTSSQSYLRSTPSEVEREDPRVAQLVERAEKHFNQGRLNLADNKREQARDEFDKAVDTILESGMDIRSNPRLRDFYLQLVERVYREEVPSTQLQTASGRVEIASVIQQQGAPPVKAQVPQVGFRDQKFEPSPLDELSKLVLTDAERNVNPEDVEELGETARASVGFAFKPNALIQQYINYYQGRGRGTMEAGLRRSGRFMKMSRKIFREEGVPEDMAWLGQVESAWRPTARSWAAASGLWQFIPSTGARFGLRQSAWVDERNSFEKATRASAKYLKWLANRYNGDWELAMGAYNTGEGNIDRAIGRAGVADFWRVYPYIAQETRNYVPNILATILVAKNPEKYGFRNIQPEAPLAYDEVEVKTATSLNLIASLTDTSVDYLRSINPELRRDVTPRGEAYRVRVAPGRGKQFASLLKRVPVERREQLARVISVAPGEDMQAVAARTGTSVAQLQQWNAGIDVSAGGKLIVPAGNMRATAMVLRQRGSMPAATGSNLITVTTQSGDTVAKIAARYNASPDEVARLNGVAANAQLERGRQIRVPASSSGGGAVARPARRRR
ncbi:MAG: transglycosylase SLT domain-containing protein [Acidobacteriota bacterium]|nr:transglycosylase SLT domain-containing protein [Acidobacteriota bacterium]